jgi:hypothetical protein
MEFLDKYDDEFIDDYLMNQLAETDKQSFENEIINNNQLNLYIKERKEILLGLVACGEKELVQNITNLAESLNEEGFFITDEEIDAYLNNLSSMSDKREIAMLCLKNEDFQKRVDQREVLLNAINSIGNEELKTSIKAVETSLERDGFFEQPNTRETSSTPKNTTAPNHLRILRWTAIAASFLLLVLAARFWVFPTGGSSSIYQTYFTALEDKLSPKIEAELSETGFGGSPAIELKELQEGMKHYQAKKYKESVLMLKSYIKQNPMADNIQEVQLYTAISYMSLNQPKEALPLLLSSSATQPQGEIAVNLQWYLALCYLQNDNKTEAISILDALVENPKYQTKANQLRQELN